MKSSATNAYLVATKEGGKELYLSSFEERKEGDMVEIDHTAIFTEDKSKALCYSNGTAEFVASGYKDCYVVKAD